MNHPLKEKVFGLVGIVVLLYVVTLVNAALGWSLNDWGILPRSLSGLWGIVFWPFLHAGLKHLLLNTAPFFILGLLVMLQGQGLFLNASWMITVVGGLGVWIFGRNSMHIGASGLIFGYLGFLVAFGWYSRKAGAVLVAVIAVALYGGILWGIVPTWGPVSWEGHLFGLLAGLLVGRILASRNRPDEGRQNHA